jgi:hypothetical protein
MELTEALKAVLVETARALTGAARRRFMAGIVSALGYGGQARVEQELGWNRVTVRKGLHERQSGLTCLDAFSARGRKRAEEHLPHLLDDLRAIADGHSQTDPTFKSIRLYTRLSVAEIRRQLISQKHYPDAALPTNQTLNLKLNQLGYTLRRVAKSRPKKNA